MISFVQTVLSLFTAAATLTALSGKVNAAQVGLEPINTPSLTFPDDMVSPKRGPGCQGISKFLSTPPVFVAEAQPPAAAQTPPNPPQPPSHEVNAASFMRNLNQRVDAGQQNLREALRNLPPIPGD
jgi:hypothetical protein